MGTDNKLARWDKIVDYFKQVSGASDRIRFRELGKSTNGNPFIALEIASADTLKNLDRYKQLRAEALFPGRRADRRRARRDLPAGQGGRPRHHDHPRDRDRRVADGGRAGAPARDRQLAAGEEDPRQRDLRPRAEPEPRRPDHGDRLVQQEPRTRRSRTARFPYLYHPYVGHDNNRDMYMFTQKESQLTAKLLWHDWFPVGVARRAPAGQQRRAHLRDAGDRSDQPERASADLSLERHPRASRRRPRSRPPARKASSTTPPTRTSGRARWRGAAGGTTRSAC